MHFFDDVFLVNEDKTIETELLFTRSGKVVLMALVYDFISELAHVADPNSNKGDGGRFVEGELS